MVAWNPAIENLIQEGDIFFQANAFADFIKMFLADARLEFRIMQKQICELSSLLHQVEPRHAGGFALELRGWNANQFGEHVAGVVEGQRLVEVAGENVFLAGNVIHSIIRLRWGSNDGKKNQ